jgi:hypothetical protein
MKPQVWFKDKKRLIEEYREAGITKCESCGGNWTLSFHHLEKRSSGRAKNTFKDTRLLCCICHDKADNRPGFKSFNELLRKLR